MNKEEFIFYLKKIGINCTKMQLEKLEIYKEFLIEYNSHTNLTAIKEEKEIYLKHFYDSLTILDSIKEKDKVLDIGTGAGFPGMVLAIFLENTQFVLLDSNIKKITFLTELQTKLQIENVAVIHARAEDFVKAHLEEFDIVTSRAVAHLRILTELSLPALKIKGLFLPLKANIEEELKESQETIEILAGEIIFKKEFNLPKENSKRTILGIEKKKTLESLYPRSFDKILKKPLKKKNK